MASIVLIVEDDTSIAAVIKDTLQDEGYDVAISVDGAALSVAEETHPALILLDLMMPVMDGYEVGRRLRANPATADVPIIVMSAGQRAQHGAAQIGAQSFLEKPFSLNQLVTTVATYAGAPERPSQG